MSGEYSQDEEGYKKGAESVMQATGAIIEAGQHHKSVEAASLARAAEKLPSDQVGKAVDSKRWSWKKKAAVGAGVVVGLAALGLGIKNREAVGRTVSGIAREGGKHIGELKAAVSERTGSARERLLGLVKKK